MREEFITCHQCSYLGRGTSIMSDHLNGVMVTLRTIHGLPILSGLRFNKLTHCGTISRIIQLSSPTLCSCPQNSRGNSSS